MNSFAKAYLLLGVSWLAPNIGAAEVLGHISEDNEPAAAPVAESASDRRIIYRVICSPEGEALPDCERPFHDNESPLAPVKLQQLPADPEAVEGDETPVKAPEADKGKKSAGKQTSSKKAAAKKKSKNKPAAKKSAKKTSAKKTKSSKH